eukprot:TRINITY_DN8110_c0_g2_i5.p1 TRINITY_DN8110_c0_g2~~TRINITY_DN8110_c0_g2_i5.p1  ORF type:complete len:599 (-),score=156.31 TRINITY_DN8110_c0_g2_i5:210-1865(-)
MSTGTTSQPQAEAATMASTSAAAHTGTALANQAPRCSKGLVLEGGSCRGTCSAETAMLMLPKLDQDFLTCAVLDSLPASGIPVINLTFRLDFANPPDDFSLRLLRGLSAALKEPEQRFGLLQLLPGSIVAVVAVLTFQGEVPAAAVAVAENLVRLAAEGRSELLEQDNIFASLEDVRSSSERGTSEDGSSVPDLLSSSEEDGLDSKAATTMLGASALPVSVGAFALWWWYRRRAAANRVEDELDSDQGCSPLPGDGGTTAGSAVDSPSLPVKAREAWAAQDLDLKLADCDGDQVKAQGVPSIEDDFSPVGIHAGSPTPAASLPISAEEGQQVPPPQSPRAFAWAPLPNEPASTKSLVTWRQTWLDAVAIFQRPASAPASRSSPYTSRDKAVEGEMSPGRPRRSRAEMGTTSLTALEEAPSPVAGRADAGEAVQEASRMSAEAATPHADTLPGAAQCLDNSLQPTLLAASICSSKYSAATPEADNASILLDRWLPEDPEELCALFRSREGEPLPEVAVPPERGHAPWTLEPWSPRNASRRRNSASDRESWVQ